MAPPNHRRISSFVVVTGVMNVTVAIFVNSAMDAGGLRILGFHSHGDTPIAGCFFLMENPKQKWMITRGTPVSGNLQMLEMTGFQAAP